MNPNIVVLPAVALLDETGESRGDLFTGPHFTMDGAVPSYYIYDLAGGVYGLIGLSDVHTDEWYYNLLDHNGEWVESETLTETFESTLSALLTTWEKEYSDDRNS